MAARLGLRGSQLFLLAGFAFPPAAVPRASLGAPVVGPEVNLGIARLGIVWDPPRLVVSLSSFVGVWLSFNHGDNQGEWDEIRSMFLFLLFVDRYWKTFAGRVLSLDR